MYVYSVLLVVVVTSGTVQASYGCKYTHIYDRKPSSCQDILKGNPNAESGIYALADGDAYCDMDSPCGGDGWTRIADVNMGRYSQDCPEGFVYYYDQSVRLCGQPARSSGSNCSSTVFSSRNITYSEVCGRVLAYQYGSTDAFGHEALRNDIDVAYVDGISITHGSPRQHIWTFANGLQDTLDLPNLRRAFCPCNSNGIPSHKPEFIDEDYYCESAVHDIWRIILYRDDPLFDNDGCGPLETACCDKGLLPYFYKALGGSFTDDIEFRICSDEGGEDTRVSVIELFIR